MSSELWEVQQVQLSRLIRQGDREVKRGRGNVEKDMFSWGGASAVKLEHSRIKSGNENK